MLCRTGIFFLIFLLPLSSCSTKKNTLATRSFHNVTARFNGYYYAGESIKEGVAKIEMAHRDDYTKILPVFIYTSHENSKLVYGEMDRAIQKTSLVIQRHTITDRKGNEIPEAVKWIDDNYLLLGKAHFYKHDYFSALESFDYVSKTYKSGSRYTAMLWMIRTYNEIGSLSMSEPIIDYIKNDSKFPKYMGAEYAAVTADFYLKQGDHANTLKHLLKALSLTRKKKIRARYSYIIAQLYQQTGNYKKATQYYSHCLKMKPPYEMVFNAIINRARLFNASSSSLKAVKKQLQKMLKDAKNTEYQDQIYYILAEIDVKENNIPAAINNLNLSVRASVDNKIQKALSYLKLAGIYFESQDYAPAESYYDSTITFLPKEHPDYESIAEKKKDLYELVKNLKVIIREDSLQKVAAMSEESRNAFIDGLIEKYTEEEKREQEAKNNPLAAGNTVIQNPLFNPADPKASKWVFDNPSAVSFGIMEFTKKWGDRKLEDNWRRSVKESILEEQGESEEKDSLQVGEKKPAASKGVSDKKSREYYLQDLPLTEDKKKKSDNRTIDAYYNSGMIYKEQLQNHAKAAASFEKLLFRYQENKHKLGSYYQLFRLYALLGNPEKADYYKNILLNKYPDTEYARIIKNPDYNRMTQEGKNKIEQFYSRTYERYSEGKYSETIGLCTQADSLYPKNFMMPKFDYLKALAIGRVRGAKEFENALTGVIIKYPKDEVKKAAEEMLDNIKNIQVPAAADSSSAVNNSRQATPAPADKRDTATAVPLLPYSFDKDAEYVWALVVPVQKGGVEKFKLALANFNTEFYGSEQLSINSSLLDMNTYVVTSSTFRGKDRAMNYYKFLNVNNELFSGLPPGSFQVFVISKSNYELFYQKKRIEEYMNFFNEHFLK